MSNKLDIKPGQVWVRRDGGKARIYATDGEQHSPVHGAYETKSGWEIAFWNLNGTYLHGSLEHSFDLIRLYDWREELAPIWAVLDPVFTCIAMDKSGSWFCYESRPARGTAIHNTIGMDRCERMDNIFTMPDPDCPWSETLTMRPEA